MEKIPTFDDPRLLAGFSSRGDCGVFQVSKGLVMVQSVDLFTPIVDDPYMFGRIAAVNAMSDIYAVGATPVCALNILLFPCALTAEAAATLHGGADAVREAGAVILGGHSVDDNEPKYGLAVTGVTSPKKLISHQGAKPG
ncbi:MAG: selenide, water dikinase SelD, partial [Nitrospinota bacterium]|nr:selenide, water dikinase SelD [Nitrospinota bacterium]